MDRPVNKDPDKEPEETVMSVQTNELPVEDPWKGVNPLDPAWRDNPYPAMKLLRENDPVNYVPGADLWRLFRYSDINRLYREAPAGNVGVHGENPGREKDSRRGGFLDFMLEKEGAEHARLRRLVVRAFNAKRIEAMRAEIQQTVDEFLAPHWANGHIDWIPDFAGLLPGTVTCRMMGVPLEDRDKFNHWTALRTNAFFVDVLPEEVLTKANEAAEEMADYFEALVEERRADPRDDLLTALIRVEEEGDRLTRHELIVQVIGLMVAGYETTIGLLGNGLRLLIEHPEAVDALRADPSKWPLAVQECLRFEGPILFNWRILWEDCDFGGTTIPAGAQVWAMMASGNRDPEHFPEPDRFDISRTDTDHLSFGGGRHWCLGQHLARLEAEIGFRTFFERARNVRLDHPGHIEWSSSFFRVPGSLPVSFDPA
ncbi:Cytochrome P450 107B1 [Mycobacterium pseudokansasii]|nr:hypothetical protein A4G27_02345 [Mycobacterium kansasii]VAZ96697.1 Cytochrome P450 107B1 [Mycobacterium pseudokansasii]VAZ98134.1 Cytochrome P450 107B1 [Mycobacterium pseudokansasii]